MFNIYDDFVLEQYGAYVLRSSAGDFFSIIRAWDLADGPVFF